MKAVKEISRIPGSIPKEQTSQYLKSGFSKVREWYKHYGTLPTNKFYDEFIQVSRFCESEAILETGVGPGNGVQRIHQHISPTCRYVAADITSDFLEDVRALGLRNVETVEADFEALPFDDASFDRYVVNMALHNAKNPLTPMREAYRVLKSGGIINISVFGDNTRNTYMELNNKFRSYTGLPYHDSLKENLKTIGSSQGLRQVGLAAGFPRVLSYAVNSIYPYTTAEEAKDLFLTFQPYVTWMENNPENAQAFVDFVHQQLDDMLVRRGEPIGFEGILMVGFKD